MSDEWPQNANRKIARTQIPLAGMSALVCIRAGRVNAGIRCYIRAFESEAFFFSYKRSGQADTGAGREGGFASYRRRANAQLGPPGFVRACCVARLVATTESRSPPSPRPVPWKRNHRAAFTFTFSFSPPSSAFLSLPSPPIEKPAKSLRPHGQRHPQSKGTRN
jgi:hypothetical protein